MHNYQLRILFSIIIISIFVITGCKSNSIEPDNTIVYEGKIYHTVLIGNQTWLKENLDVGVMIDSAANPSNDGIIEKYCYKNNPANCTTYGGLYQWNEAMAYSTTPGTKGICPNGWHIPTVAELWTLKTAVDNNGNALKAIGQGNESGSGTNTSGFTALLAGYRDRDYSSSFSYLGTITIFWSSIEYSSDDANIMFMFYYDDYIFFNYEFKERGVSVRCVQD